MFATARTTRRVVTTALPLAAALFAAAPALAQYTTYTNSLALGMDDGAITPDGRFAILRTTEANTATYVIDLATGTEVAVFLSNFAGLDTPGPCNDAVEVTNSRAVSLGATVKLIDLTTSPPSEITEIMMGDRPRDVAISDDGRFAIIQGGGQGPSGTYVLDMQNGAQLLFRASDAPPIFELGHDLAEATMDHGITLAFDSFRDETIITVVELDPTSGGGPRIVLGQSLADQLDGRPMDVAVSPDGRLAAIRGEREIALLRLDGLNTQIIQRVDSFPGNMVDYLDTAFDSIVMNDDVYASITIGDGASADGFLTVGDEMGTIWFALLDGTPRDLAITPDGETLLVHTGQKLIEFDLGNLQAGGGALSTVNFRPFAASTSGLLAGLDSVVCTNEFAAVFAPVANGTRVRIFDLTQGPEPVRIYGDVVPGTPIDIDMSRDNAWVAVNTQERYQLIDMRTLTLRIDSDLPGFSAAGYPWSDGIALHPEHAAYVGVTLPNSPQGWGATVDAVSRETLSCRSLDNSTGETADLFALGSTRVQDNDLELYSRFAPAGVPGLFLLGNTQNNVLLGGGRLCLQGAVVRFPIQVTAADGTASQTVDITTLPPVGGGVVVGSTWYAQFVFRDAPMNGGFNYSNASSLLFE